MTTKCTVICLYDLLSAELLPNKI